MNPLNTTTGQLEVLLVEDDAAARDMLATALRLNGYQVRTAADGLAGLRLLDAYEPDVIVLDLALPIATGFDVIRELRGAVRHNGAPVIAISGFDDNLRKAQETNEFFMTLAKPFDPEVLVRAVDRAIRQYQVQSGLGPVEPAGT